jgi:bleomycin hydrolase
MKKVLLSFIIAIFTFSSLYPQTEDKEKKDAYQFTDQQIIPHTEIRNQNRSGTCWSFSGLALFEAELMRMGKGKHDLSEMFIVRNTYFEKAVKYVRMHGQLNFGGGGAFNDVSYVIDKFGMIPEEIYDGIEYGEELHVHYELDLMLKSMVDAVIKNKNKKLSLVWQDALLSVIETYLGEVPEKFEYQGKEFTPKSFAEDFMELKMENYPMFTSYTHHDFYSEFALEVPDNWMNGNVNNVPLNELMDIIDNALKNGYTVAWAADVSEKGFSWKDGIAIVPETDIEKIDDSEKDKWAEKSEKERLQDIYKFDKIRKEKQITQEDRQIAFDNYQTTDDHGMLIVGTAKDQNGNLYYKIKNSWGTDQKYEGYFYASRAYVAYKTMSIMLHKDGVPKPIMKKFN